MDRLFSNLVKQHTPQVNPLIMNGLAVHYMKKTEEYIHQAIMSASKSLPKGLVYVGYERCNPIEEYEQTTKPKNNKRTFDLARSDIYLVKYKFTFNGEPIDDRYIYLPYVSDGGVITLGGAKMHITPVMSDKVISPGSDNVFVRLLRDKIIFKRSYHNVVVDGVRETTHVVWSRIHRKPMDNKRIPPTTKAQTSAAHYLFAKHGFSYVFQRYCGFVPVVGEDEINTDTYDPKKWVICESAMVKPKTYIGEFYKGSNIRLAIPRDKWDATVKGFVVGFYYVVDHFPDRFKPTYVDNIDLWKILLGHIIFSGLYGENKLFTNITEHYSSLDSYVDGIIIEKLKENNYHIEDFYDLLALLIVNFNSLILNTENNTTSMYGKTLEVLYYVLFDITSSIFKVNFRLNKSAMKRPLTKKDVNEAFNKNMKPRAIFGLTSGKIISEAVSYSGDHMYPKITSKITEQESLPGATRGKAKRTVVGEDKHLDVSMIEAGSILYLSKSNPSPTNRLNPFAHIDIQTGTIIRNPVLKETLDATQAILKNIGK